MLTDPDGRDQPLVAAYRAEALRRELALTAAEHGTLAGLPLRLLTDELALVACPTPPGRSPPSTATPGTTSPQPGPVSGSMGACWMNGSPQSRPNSASNSTSTPRMLLDLARDAAHGVARPAAPLTTFLVGYAAATAGGGEQAVAEAVGRARALAERWAKEAESGDPGA